MNMHLCLKVKHKYKRVVSKVNILGCFAIASTVKKYDAEEEITEFVDNLNSIGGDLI